MNNKKPKKNTKELDCGNDDVPTTFLRNRNPIHNVIRSILFNVQKTDIHPGRYIVNNKEQARKPNERKKKKTSWEKAMLTNLPDIKSTLHPPKNKTMPTTPKNPTHPLSHLPVRLTHFLGYRPSPPPPISEEPRYAVYIWSFIGSFAGLAILQVIFQQEVWVRRGVAGVVGSWVRLFSFFFFFVYEVFCGGFFGGRGGVGFPFFF